MGANLQPKLQRQKEMLRAMKWGTAGKNTPRRLARTLLFELWPHRQQAINQKGLGLLTTYAAYCQSW
jgi:hypothetical protein